MPSMWRGSYFRPASHCVPVVGLKALPARVVPPVGWNDSE